MFETTDCIKWEHHLEDLNYYLSDLPENEHNVVHYKTEDKEGRQDKFVDIYKNNWWMSKKSKSGEGSEMKFAERVMQVLDKVGKCIEMIVNY